MLRIALIGWGYWGPRLARNIISAGCELAGIADPVGDRRIAATTEQPGVLVMADAEALMRRADVEAVVIATPIVTHFPLAMSALGAGKHVLVEKTIAASSADAATLVHEAARHDCVLMVNHTFLFCPAMTAIRALLAAGTLGRLQSIESSRLNSGIVRDDVHVLWDVASHDLAILDDLGLDPPSTVSASVAARGQGQAPTGSLVLSYANDARARIHASWLSPTKVRRVIFRGSDATLIWDEMAPDRLVISEGIGITPKSIALDTGVEPLRAVIAHFAACVRGVAAPRSDGLMGLRVVRQLEAADRSIREGGRPCAI